MSNDPCHKEVNFPVFSKTSKVNCDRNFAENILERKIRRNLGNLLKLSQNHDANLNKQTKLIKSIKQLVIVQRFSIEYRFQHLLRSEKLNPLVWKLIPMVQRSFYDPSPILNSVRRFPFTKNL